jgi:hypothetical protein
MFIEQLQRYGHGEDHPFLHVAAPFAGIAPHVPSHRGPPPQHLPKKLRAEPLGLASGADLKPARGRGSGLLGVVPRTGGQLKVDYRGRGC